MKRKDDEFFIVETKEELVEILEALPATLPVFGRAKDGSGRFQDRGELYDVGLDELSHGEEALFSKELIPIQMREDARNE